MASNAQDRMVVQEPQMAGVDVPIGMSAAETQEREVEQRPFADVRANIRDALRSWTVGRKIWDRALAWMAAHRSVRSQSSSGDPPTQND